MKESVSVITTVFNNASFVKSSVRSVLSQSLKDFEYIILDDGSTDESFSICQKLAIADRRIKLFRQPNGGFGGVPAFNTAFAKSGGQIIARCDADDIWMPSKLATQLDIMARKPEYIATFTQAKCIDEYNEPCDPPFPGCFDGQGEGEELAHRLIRGNFLCHSTAIFRRQALLQVGSYSSANFRSTDHDLWLRFASLGSMLLHPQILTLYRIHRSNVSFANASQCMADAYKVLQKNLPKINKRWPMPTNLFAESLRVIAMAAYQAGDFSVAQDQLSAIRHMRELTEPESHLLRASHLKLRSQTQESDNTQT